MFLYSPNILKIFILDVAKGNIKTFYTKKFWSALIG